MNSEERELVRKLILTGHLNVPERKLLPGRIVRSSQIRAVLGELLQSGSPFRAWWLPDDSMVGCVIEYRGAATGRVEWKYRGIEGDRTVIREFETDDQATEFVLAAAKPLFGQAIDGIPIDWNS